MAAEEEKRLRETLASKEDDPSRVDGTESIDSGQTGLRGMADDSEKDLDPGGPETDSVESGSRKGFDTSVIAATATVAVLVALAVLYLLLRRRGRHGQKKN